jgi:hypothetical protein
VRLDAPRSLLAGKSAELIAALWDWDLDRGMANATIIERLRLSIRRKATTHGH